MSARIHCEMLTYTVVAAEKYKTTTRKFSGKRLKPQKCLDTIVGGKRWLLDGIESLFAGSIRVSNVGLHKRGFIRAILLLAIAFGTVKPAD